MPQNVINGTQLHKHNDYHKDGFLKFTAADGMIHTRNGARAFLATEDFFMGLQKGLEAEVGEASAKILYKCGLKWGLRDMQLFIQRLEKESGKKLQEMKATLFLEQWWRPFQEEGWGSWKLDLAHRKQGMIFIDLYNSAVASSLGNAGQPVCHHYAGMFAGVFTFLTKMDLTGIELQCDATGGASCKFIIGTEKRINAAESWLREGVPATEIIRKLME